MKKLHTIMMAAMMATAAACTEDLPIDAEPTEGVLCLNGFLYSDCDTNAVYVTTTGLKAPQNVKDATVRMYINGGLAELKPRSDSPDGGYYRLPSKFHPGDIVRVEAEYNGQRAYREAQAPAYPTDVHFDITPVKDKSYYDQDYEEYVHYDMYRIDISFSDIPSATTNYYRLYTCDTTFKIDTRDHRRTVVDTIYHDGEPYTYERDSVYSSRDTIRYISGSRYYDEINDDLYIGEAAPLTDEEMSAGDEFLDGLYNFYNVFNNSRFAGGRCDMRVYKKAYVDGVYSYGFPPEVMTVYDEDETPPEYYYTQYLGIESLDEQAYFYIKSLNGYMSGAYDNDELTGALKMWRNVKGGSGNVSVCSRVVEKVVVLDGYKPSVKVVDRDDTYRW